MNLRQLLLLWVWKVSLVWGQATENVRQNTYALEDGRTIWNIARIQDTNIWKNNPDISQPGAADALDKSSLDDMVVVYDANRTLLFQKPVPKVIKDKEAQWVSLPNGDLGYFYVKFGTHTLYLQIYSPTGEPTLGPFPYSEVLCFSASASSQRVDGRHYIAVAFVETNLQVKLLLLNPDGSQVSDPMMITSSYDASAVEIDHKIHTTAAADGSYLVIWSDKARNNNQAIRAAYYKPGQLISKPFIVASASNEEVFYMTIVKCDSLRTGDGHYCIYDEILKKTLVSRTSYIATFSHAGSISILPKALTSGNIIQAVNSEPSRGTVLPYGGLLLSSNGPTLVFDENWVLQTKDAASLKPYTLTVLSNNTVISLEKLEGNGQPGDWMIWKGWKASLANASKNIQQSKYNDNPIIKSTSPDLGGEISLNTDSIKITFTREDFRLGFGNISIYAAEYPQYPRQFITVVPGYSNIGPSYVTPVSRYAFNTPNTNYYVAVDGGAFHSKIDEPLMGVKTGVWFFKTAAKTQPNESADTVLQIRISNDVSEDSNTVSSLLKDELSQILPVEKERISVRRLRSDGDAGDIYQVTLKRLHGNGKQTAANLALDFKAMLTNKLTSGLQMGSTTRSIDSEHGVIIEENVFSSNKWVFTGILCGGVVFLVLFGVMHRRYPDSNNLMILMLVISLFDFVSDLFFVVMNSGDVPSLRIPSIVFFVIPFAFNMVASTGIIVKEVSTNPYFHEWFTRRTLVTSAVSVLSATNPYLLNLLSSKIGGMSDLDAPMSSKVSKWILYCTAIDIIIEDIPQLVIQTLYKTNNGYFKLAPLLSLVSSCLGIILAIISNIFTYLAHKNPPKNIARKGTDFKGSHFQINETIEQAKYI